MSESNNTTSAVTEEPAGQQDSFLEGWDDTESTPAPETADQQTEQKVQETGSAEENPGEAGSNPTDPQTGTPAAETPAKGEPETPGQTQQQEPAATWTVKHMDQTLTISARDITPELLQKGLDYDRIRGKYDEAKPLMKMFGNFAAQAGMNIPDYVKLIRAEAKKAGGMSEAEARKAVELEDREAAVSAKEAQQRMTVNENDARRSQVRADLDQFARAFPQVYEQAKRDRTVIPESVWSDVQAGLPLAVAYARHMVAEADRKVLEANQRAEDAGKNQRNAQRAAASMQSAGSGEAGKDPFLEGWDS